MAALQPLKLTDAAAVLANAKAVRERLRGQVGVPDRQIRMRGGHAVPTDSREYAPLEFKKLFTAPIEDISTHRVNYVRFDEIERKVPSIVEVQETVAFVFGVSLTEMLSARRTMGIYVPRQIAIALCRHLTMRSFPEIGRKFNRDHTTILHSARKYESLVTAVAAQMSENALVIDWVAACKEALK